jgi:hypothetical protein
VARDVIPMRAALTADLPEPGLPAGVDVCPVRPSRRGVGLGTALPCCSANLLRAGAPWTGPSP